jgi:hypothetical protein
MVKKLLTFALGLTLAFGALAQTGNNAGHVQPPQPKDISFSEDDIEFWVGTGSNTSMVIIAWDENYSGDDFALVWGVRWSGNVTALDLVDSIATHDSRLTYDFSTAQGSHLMLDISYNDGTLVGNSPSGWCYYLNNAWAMNAYDSQPITDGDIIEISANCMFTMTDAMPATDPNPQTDPPTDPVDATLAHSEILYWVGEGSNEALFIVSFAEPDTAFAWGYRFDNATIQQMVNDIDAADPRLEIVGNPSYDGDIHFVLDNGDTLGLSPVDPVRGYNFWWTNLNGVSVASMTTTLHNNDYFKYGDLNSATDWDFQYGYYLQEAWTKVPTPVSVPDTSTTPEPPTNPVDATLAHSDILYWVGEGSNEALFIVSFAEPDTAFAWGYRFNSATIQQMVNDIDAADPRLEIVGNPSYDGDIHFVLDNGDTLGLSPIDPVRGYNFWWTNLNGLSVASMTTTLHNNDYFKYGDLNSATDWDFQNGYYIQEAWTKVPTPVAAPADTTSHDGIADVETSVDRIWPNPANSCVNVETHRSCEAVLYDLAGRQMATYTFTEGINTINLSNLKNGIYMLRTEGSVRKIVKN